MTSSTNLWATEGPRYAVIDGDLLAYPAAAKLEKEDDLATVHDYLDSNVIALADSFNLDDFTIFLSTSKNFRKEIYPEYKANRESSQVPRWLAPCKEFLYKNWAAKAEIPYEADDLLGIAVTADPSVLLVSYDKDLKQIPGWHGDPRDSRITYIGEATARRKFLLQLISGDATDNCPGVYRFGPKKAEAWYESTAWNAQRAWELYKERGYDFEYFSQMYKCLYILRQKELAWPELQLLL